MTGSFPDHWIHGSPDCVGNTDPPIQVHAYDADTLILRESKCADVVPNEGGPSFEAPFMYLLFGSERVLLVDTGTTADPQRVPLGATVRSLIDARHASHSGAAEPLVVCHSHSHSDHVLGDAQFTQMAGTIVVKPRLEGAGGVRTFFGFTNWPDQVVTIDLGSRPIDVIPIPGHEQAHIALFDRNSGLLLTGDTLYPGLLVVNGWKAYRASIDRLVGFVERPGVTVAHIAGAHVEMTSTPFVWFTLGTLFQPNEHRLQLDKSHLIELHNALNAIGDTPRTDRHKEFIIFPAEDPLPPEHP